MKGEWVIFPGIPKKDRKSLNEYLAAGGYEAARKVLTQMGSQDVIEEVKKSGLRGRGGAGFPAGVKWGFVPRDVEGPRYLCCNADEGEPGTFKDREILLHVPHQLIEGMIIASYAIGANKAFVYVRGEFHKEAASLQRAIDEAKEKGFLGENLFGSDFSLDIVVHMGAGAYVCGEETALINSIEGRRGWPRLRPPFPAVKGLYGRPTIVNNVETLASVPFIISRGADEFRKYGTEKSAGTKLFAVSGWVKKPGVYERELGIPLKELLEDVCGGSRDGRPFYFVIPGGISAPPLTADELDVTMDYEALAEKGTMLGSGAVMVFPEGTCPVRVALRAIKFYEHESCGQCTPCREGSGWVARMLEDVEKGQLVGEDLELLADVAQNIFGKTVCPLGDSVALVTLGFLKKFREEFEKHLDAGRCPYAE